jgi:hypothetical protein
MLYREIIAVCSQIHTKHINTLCGQNVQLLNVKLAVHIVTTGRKGLIRRHWQKFWLCPPYCYSLLMLLKSHSAGNQFCCWLNSMRRKRTLLTTQLLLLHTHSIFIFINHLRQNTSHGAVITEQIVKANLRTENPCSSERANCRISRSRRPLSWPTRKCKKSKAKDIIFLWCDVVSLGERLSMFRRIVLPSSSG